MGDFTSLYVQILKFYLTCAAVLAAVAYGLLRLLGLHPLTAIAGWVGL